MRPSKLKFCDDPLVHNEPGFEECWDKQGATNIRTEIQMPVFTKFGRLQDSATTPTPELSGVSSSVRDLRRALRATLRLLLGLGALAAVGTFLFADLAVGLIYRRGHFDPAVSVLQVFAPALPLFFMDILFGSAITAVGKTKEIAVVKALSVAVSTGLAILLIPIFQACSGNGGIGLVLAFGSTEVLMLTAFLWLLPRGALDRSAQLDFLRAAAAAGGTVLIFWILPSMTPWVAVPACVTVFMVLAFASGSVLRQDLDNVADHSGASLRSCSSEKRDRTKRAHIISRRLLPVGAGGLHIARLAGRTGGLNGAADRCGLGAREVST
jgi:Polysaccharide biosynthesis C-terminal domain